MIQTEIVSERYCPTDATSLEHRSPAEHEPQAAAAAGVHEAVLRQLSRLPRGRLLDAPAGEGALSMAARSMGFEVTALDIEPDRFRVPDLYCERIDLQQVLPYPDASFDVVVSVEAIEHLENPFHLLRELRRVLRPGGRLILTTPNILSLPSRVRILTTGLASFFDFDLWLHSSGHIMPISAPQLHTVLTMTGFTVRTVTGNRVKPGARLMQPFVPLVRRWTRRSVTNKALRDLLTSAPVLLCEVLVVVAE